MFMLQKRENQKNKKIILTKQTENEITKINADINKIKQTKGGKNQ